MMKEPTIAPRPRRSGAVPPSSVPQSIGLRRRIRRWLEADPRDVVAFAPRSGPASSRPTGEAGRADLYADLRRWRGTIARWQAVAALRRWAVIAIALAIVLVLLQRLFLPLPIWLLIAAPAVVLAGGVARALRRPPSVAAVARLLDHHLDLKEQVASALEVTGGTSAASGSGAGDHGILSGRVQARATTLVEQALRNWTARPRAARGEWTALTAVCVALVVAVSVPIALPATGGARLARSAAPSTTSSAIIGAYPAGQGAQAHPAVAIQVRVAETSTPGTAGQHRSSGQRASVQHPRAHSSSAHHGSGSQQNQGGQGAQGGGIPASTSKVAVPAAAKGTLSGGRATGTTQGNGRQSGSTAHFVTRSQTSPGQPARSGNGQSTPAKSGTASSRQAQGAARQGTNGGRQGSSATSKGTGRGTSAHGSGHNGQAGAAGPVQQRSPYGGPLPFLKHALPKPGLITGPGLLSGHHAPGKSSAGRSQGSNTTGTSTHAQAPSTRGRQLTLQSPYSGAPGKGQRQPGASTAHSYQRGTAHASGQGATGEVDYVLPDANVVAPDDRSVVGGYFAPSSAR